MPTTWASLYSGYETKALPDSRLWENHGQDQQLYGTEYLNMFEFFMKNNQYAPDQVMDMYRRGSKEGSWAYR
jgi:hypothetical protein